MLHKVFFPDIPSRSDPIAAVDIARERCVPVDFLHMLGEGCLGRERLLRQLLRPGEIVEGIAAEGVTSLVRTSRKVIFLNESGVWAGFGNFLVVQFVITMKMLDQVVSASKPELAPVKLAEFARKLGDILCVTIDMTTQHIYPAKFDTTQTLKWVVPTVMAMRLLLIAGFEGLATLSARP